MEPEVQQANVHELAHIPAPHSRKNANDRPEASAQRVAEPLSHRRRFKHLASLIALSSTALFTALNTTIVATAIPTICNDLGSAEGYAWIGGAYLLGNAAFSPIWAKFSDIWGRKIILLCTVAGFFCSSIAAALSTSMNMLIISRAVQGSFGGGVQNLVSIVISDMFSVRHRSLYLGLFEVFWSISGGVGPLIGGAFAQHLSWRWIFWIMLPPSAVAFVLLTLGLEVHDPRTRMADGLRAVDWAGSFCILSVLTMVLLGLSFGGVEFPWKSPAVICLLVLGALMSAAFVFSEKRLARYPIVPLGIFARRSNVAVLVVAFVHYFALTAAEFYLPLFFQAAKTLSPTDAGTILLPSILSASLTSLLAGFYINRTGRYRELFWIGLVLMVAGHGSFLAWDPTSSFALLVATQLLAGCGAGLLFTPPVIAIQASVPQDDVGTATATTSTLQNVATVLAVVIGQVILQHGMDEHQGQLKAAGLNETLSDAFQGSRAAASVNLVAEIADPLHLHVVEQAFMESLRGVWLMDISVVAVGLLASGWIIQSRLSEEHTETRTGLREQGG